MEQKLQRGFRVEILSRNADCVGRPERWENTAVGAEAIIEHSSLERPADFEDDGGYGGDYDEGAPAYRILIFYQSGEIRSHKWFEEKYLQLICSNVEKGKVLLKQHGR